MKNLCYLVFLAMLLPISAYSKATYPFPQSANYKYGVKPTTLISTSTMQAAYKDFLTRFYEENGSQARIKFDDAQYTVSEGIGYGMLIMVYMDNDENNTQAKFDKLWSYYNAHLDSYGLMNWKISGFEGTAASGQNSASDAELDVATALIQAYKQWGNES